MGSLKDTAPRDWGAFVVTILIIVLFSMYEYAVVYLKAPPNDTLSGILNNLMILAAGYWLGSSSGSKNKDAVIAQAATAAQVESKENGKVVPSAPSHA